jgi:hypothetical protein
VALEESLALTGRNVPIPSAETELRALIDGANAFVMLLQGDKSDLPWLWEHMNDLGSTNEAEIRQRAHGAMGEFSLRRNRVDAADGAFGRLRAKTLHHYPGLPKEGIIAPKSAAAMRTVPIAVVLRDFLVEHKQATGGSEGLVFGRSAETPFDARPSRGAPIQPGRRSSRSACTSAGTRSRA